MCNGEIQRKSDMRLFEFYPVIIAINGFALIAIKGDHKMKNVKSEYYGIREIFVRSLFGIYFGKKFITIHFLYFMKRWEKL